MQSVITRTTQLKAPMPALRTRLLTAVLASCCLSFVAACASGPGIPVSTIYQSQQCAIEDAQLIFLDNSEQLYSFIESVRGFQLAGEASEIAPLPAGGRAIVVALGDQTSGGYNLLATSDRGSVEQGILRLPVEFISPAEDNMVSQQLTSPCIVMGISSKEGYSQVGAGDFLSPAPSPAD